MSDKNIIKRLLDISYENQLHHLGSYFSCIETIDDIYKQMDDDDIFILSNGHAAVALYVVLEKHFGLNAEMLLKEMGEHPKRNELKKVHCSTGSLGMGITVAVGRALADKDREVYCMISDGECSEGAVWESLRFINEHKLENIHIYVNANGWAAYDSVDLLYLEKRLKAFYPRINFVNTTVEKYGLSGLSAHYVNMTEDQYLKAVKSL
ncbi:thiamine pyrophosphate-dependent enzyme [Acidimicrobiia bacterium]|jgi:transketolase|nr:thiamine pyrophosphate-dependent enzyme [Acidimicrobiia bacterium]|tara:strand:- start:25732 stop:26355 length:624 start_codon:yes stop_codon:yes gene_type:complete